MGERYNFKVVEDKWRKIWEEKRAYAIDLDKAKKPFYNLMMFPYPSAQGIHVGNCFAYIGTDIFGRYKRMKGFDVFEPMGFDAFGIHSENYALKVGKHPQKLTKENIENFTNQLKKLGLIVDWNHSLDSSSPEYYHWTQWIFLQLYKNGLAEKRHSPVNWCDSCSTVLADSQVVGGKCERCDSVVEQKNLKQWFFKITDYAGKLLSSLDKLDWSDAITTAQKRKIGYSEGAYIIFKTEKGDGIEVFTTRPDTIFGATYLVLAPEHPLVPKLATKEQKKNIDAYVQEAAIKSRFERAELVTEKIGVFTGSYAINPVNNAKIPVWIADYILMDYGTGAIMAVPGHDQRDFDFAKEKSLPIVEVVSQTGKPLDKLETVYSGEGTMVNSGGYNGMNSAEFAKNISKWFEKNKCGRPGHTYRLRDWCISRQRYWGPPIPIVYCEKCGTVPVPEKDLPVLLPESDDYIPDGSGKSPLARNEKFMNTKCPECGGKAKREGDVSDNFLDSAWYHLRYLSTDSKKSAFNDKRMKNWLPIASYIGGKEHAEGHLLYFRFITMALNSLGFVPVAEPVARFRAHGIITKDGAKMSKSKGNVVNPDEYIDMYGTDVLRMYLMFIGPFQLGGDFSDSSINGCKRFLEKVYDFFSEGLNDRTDDMVMKIVSDTVKKVENDIEQLNYNTAIAQMMTLFNAMKKEDIRNKQVASIFVKLLHPFAPHMTEEIWREFLGEKDFLCNQVWPDAPKVDYRAETKVIVVQVNGKLRDKMEVDVSAAEESIKNLALESEKVKSHIEGQKVIKVIYIRDKLVNIVVK